MKIKISMGDKSTVVSPEWLLEHFEDDVPELLICGGCNHRDQTINESYEPFCYGECIENWLEELQDFTIKFEVVK